MSPRAPVASGYDDSGDYSYPTARRRTAQAPVVMMAPPSPYQARQTERRANFQASLDRNRAAKQVGIDTRRAELAASRGQTPAPSAPAAPAAPASPYAQGNTIDPAKKEYYESKIAQAKDAYARIPESDVAFDEQRKKAQAAIDAAYKEQQDFFNPQSPAPAQPAATPAAPAAPAAPFVSQKARIDVSEQMAKTIFDNILENNNGDQAAAAAEFESKMAEYGRDGQALVRNWMGDGAPGSNPLGYSMSNTGGELREMPSAPEAPPAPRRVLTGTAGRAGMYDTEQGRVMVDAGGQRVGGIMAPPAPRMQAMQGPPQYELGPYTGFRSVPTGEQPAPGGGKYDAVSGQFRGGAMAPQNRAIMNQAIGNAAAVTIASDAERDALPSGTLYRGPDGLTRRKL
jgi:hypothetical protein